MTPSKSSSKRAPLLLALVLAAHLLALLQAQFAVSLHENRFQISNHDDDEAGQQLALAPRRGRQLADPFENARANSSATIQANNSSSSSSILKAPADSEEARGGGGVLRLQVTAIHVERAEFPLSKLLFKLTLRLALAEASRFLEAQQRQVQLLQQQQQRGEQRNQEGEAAAAAAGAHSAPPVRVELRLSVRSGNTCSRQYAGALAAEEFYLRRARLFVVSGCDDAIRGVSRLASQWRVPIMTAAGFGADLNDKRAHRTLIRVAFSLRAAVEFLFKIMKSFAWRRINLIVDESDANSLALRGSIEQHAARLNGGGGANNATSAASESIGLNTIAFDLQALLRNNQELEEGAPDDDNNAAAAAAVSNQTLEELEDKWPSELSERAVRDALWQSSLYSRVTVLLVPQQFVRKLLLAAHDQHMANGHYTFINMPLLANQQQQQQLDGVAQEPAGGAEGSPARTPAGNFAPRRPTGSGGGGEGAFLWRAARSRRNAQAKRAFESLMSIYLRTPPTKAYVFFAGKLNELANARPRELAPNETVQPRVQLNINPYSASFYDGLQIYAAALAESLRLQASDAHNTTTSPPPSPLTNASAPAWDANAVHARISELVRDRRFDNMVTGNVYINANGDRETDYTLDDMNPITGRFAPVISYRGETRDIERLARIHWSSDASVGPTSDSADCARLGTCQGRPITRFTLLLFLLAGPLLLLLAGLFYFVHSRLSLESQLVDHWWKIHLSELELVATRRKNANDGSLVFQSGVAGTGTNSLPLGSQVSLQSNGGLSRRAANRLALANSTSAAAPPRHSSPATSTVGAAPHLRHSAAAAACDRTEVTKATDTSAGWASSAQDACYGNITLATYKLAKVALKPISRFHPSRKLMIELRSLKDINHNNLCRFVGILVDEGSLALVSEFCPKGSLREFFHNESMVIDWTFKYSIINDIMAGLLYLHSSALAFHGRLKSSNCLVSGRFVVKLSDYGPHSLYEQLDGEAAAAAASQQQQQPADGAPAACDDWLKGRLWLAPEHMGAGRASLARVGSMRGDVYSFGLLLYEIITNTLPFFNPDRDDYVLPLRALFQELKSKGASELICCDQLAAATAEGDKPPAASAQTPAAGATPVAQTTTTTQTTPAAASIGPLVELMQACWRFEPAKRPSSASVNAALKKITRNVTSKKLLENLTARMEQYTNNLESLVEAKLACLVEEKQRSEELLYQFVPKSIASLLKEGQFVEPEAFECVTVFYSDIVGFTSLSSESSPMEVVDFLSDLYLCFDATLEQHDIFKVDTIGDAYIVASGLPQRNGAKHVVEIAQAALELRDRLKSFRIPHKPGRSLEMRVGIHSGPCIAGIVGGLNMPKYCVFGDTLATGKFMESSGLPMRIHITDESRQLLAQRADFSIEPRAPRITRDGLPFQTYWLERGGGGGC